MVCTVKQISIKSLKLLFLFLSMLFLFAGCGGEDKPYEQLCDITSHIAGKPEISGLQESEKNATDSVIFTDFEAYQNACDLLKTTYQLELPKVKEKAFENNVYL